MTNCRTMLALSWSSMFIAVHGVRGGAGVGEEIPDGFFAGPDAGAEREFSGGVADEAAGSAGRRGAGRVVASPDI